MGPKELQQLILQTNCSETRFQHECELWGNIPKVVGQQKNDIWNTIVFSIFNCGNYLPQVFSKNKNYRLHPIVHILSKGLPQRSQFRNFSQITQHATTNAELLRFFQSAFFWSISGLHYNWSKIFIPVHKRVWLFDFFVRLDINWKTFFTKNVRLLFFVLKEHLCYLVRQQPALRQALIKKHNWLIFESDISRIMNNVRCVFATESAPFRSMLSKIQQHVPHSFPQQQPIPSETILNNSLFNLHHKEFGINISSNTFDELVDYNDLLRRKAIFNQAIYTLSETVHQNDYELNDEARLIHDNMNLVDKSFFNDLLLTNRLLDNVKIIPLPLHVAKQHAFAIQRRHDLYVHDAEKTRKCSEFYFCFCCEDAKCFVAKNQKNASNCVSSFGHQKLAHDPRTGACYCIGSSSRKKIKHIACADMPCVKIHVLGRIVVFYGNMFTLCSICGCLCSATMNDSFLEHQMYTCGHCTKKNNVDELFCTYCLRKSGSLKKYCLYNDIDANGSPWTTASLCLRHSRPAWKQTTILLKSELMEMFS